ncbi:hypothetical protein [Sediminibacillus terrae]|uniref:hypothetical protein n=1 Tax=Sediminibacillus terrae TaxID=1562106 RepID=UPI0012977D18|nr:hypothetical protein [Sediminibacillus terrae]
MNYMDHFLPEDIAEAELAVKIIGSTLYKILKLTDQGKVAEAKNASIDLTKSLVALDILAYKKRSNNRMYLHHIMAKPDRWFKNE